MNFLVQYDNQFIPCRDLESGLNYLLQCIFRSDRQMFGHWRYLGARERLPDYIEYMMVRVIELSHLKVIRMISVEETFLNNFLQQRGMMPECVKKCPQWKKLIEYCASPPPILNFITNSGPVGRFCKRDGDGALIYRIQSFLW